jgi:hypothetical protein
MDLSMTLKVACRIATAVCCSAAVLTALACASDDDDEPATATPLAASTPAAPERLTLQGTLTLDGGEFETDFMGVRVIDDGLAAICQAEIPPVFRGAYQVDVMSAEEAPGCGAPGAEMLVWAYVGEQFLYATETIAWSAAGDALTFDGALSSAAPQGAALPTTGFRGEVTDGAGDPLPPGTTIEATIDGTRCGVTSLRSGDFEGYSLLVSGPELLPSCARGGTITFTIDGEPATQTAVNDLATEEGHVLDLSTASEATPPPP